ncbi:MAG TPA: acyl-CoA dehydrogenase family protein [Acidimicrobiales bacterium]|nr:acyl-CoA dehydrogenase family protein [Acidimicrobiales bacterium]
MTSGTADRLVREAARIGEEVAGPAADDVDRKARFPAEAMEALRSARLLSVLVPEDLGGEGVRIGQVADAVCALARHCGSTAMVYAMHQMQVACLVRHGRSGYLVDYQRALVDRQLLLASATTEIGVGGDIRSSVCAVERGDGRFRLEKKAPVISYGESADGVMTTARRSPESPPSDQVLVLCTAPGLALEATSGWDTLGMRGTCSLGFSLVAEGDEEQVLDDPFADIASRTMLPVSHVLWSSVWLGLASAAVDRARRFVRTEARKNPGVTSPAAVRLAKLMTVYQQMEALVHGAARTYDEVYDDLGTLSGMGFAIAMNGLKVSSSTLVVEIVGEALTICGIAGYREDSPYSLGRLLRDAHGAAVMVNNDRIIANNAQMLLVHKED